MTKKPKVSIVITAFNEEANIAYLLEDIASQKQDNYYLNEVLVISDGSTDATVVAAKQLKKPYIKVVAGIKKLGKVARLNKVFRSFNSDILVQLDADIRLANKYVLKELVSTIGEGKWADLVFGMSYAVKPKTSFEILSYFGYELWNKAIELTGHPIRYYANGQIRAFSKRLITTFRFLENETDISEDTYSFYYARIHGFKIMNAYKAKVFFKLTDNFSDYLKQMKRFLKAPARMEEYFGHEASKKYEIITTKVRLKAFILKSLRSPIVAIGYLGLQIFVRIVTLFSSPKAAWETSLSSKTFKENYTA